MICGVDGIGLALDSEWNVVPPESRICSAPARAYSKNKSLFQRDNLFTLAFIVEDFVIKMANWTTGCEHRDAAVVRIVAAELAAGETNFWQKKR